MVEFSAAIHSQCLLNCTTDGSSSVSVQAHPTLNTTLSVISELDLLSSTKEQILKNLKDPNITDARPSEWANTSYKAHYSNFQ